MKTPFSEIASEWEQANADVIMDYFRSYLQQVVTLHSAMFERLLSKADGVPLEMAELFEDVANTYMGFSETISRLHLERTLSEIEE